VGKRNTAWTTCRECPEQSGPRSCGGSTEQAELTGAEPRRLTLGNSRPRAAPAPGSSATRGISSGDVVMLQLPNTSELIVLYYALSKLGAVISPLAVQYGAHELGHFAAELSTQRHDHRGESAGSGSA
jgi:acyl-CoA synthetase (AMP-forming)/AMP-acid ligase II